MAIPSSGKWVATLWFVAAGLAFVAVAISLGRERGPNLPVAAGGIFCLIMGIVASRGERPPR